ncbi:MAG TPA: hypothetical protein VM736_00425 [Gemmatimonadales bacterium]|nr:hypothetical protein [Gemmatimonadales bacterium]
MLRTALIALVFFLCLPPAPASARSQQQWVHLGARRVSSRGERDIIRTMNGGKFKRIRLTVEGGELEMFDVQVTFADGSTFSPSGRFTFTGHSRARVIALPGAARVIRWITFYYRSLPSGGHGGPTVQAYGRQ